MDLPLTTDADSSVCVVASLGECCFQEYVGNIASEDFFYEWFEGKLDLDQDDSFIAESLDQSPRCDDSEWMSVRVARAETSFPESYGQDTFIILDFGSHVSTFLMEKLELATN